MHTNVAGPLKITEAFIENVRISKQKKIIAITSAAASISKRPLGANHYWYYITKAAENQAMHLLATQFEKEPIVVAMFHPGGVQVESFGDVKLPGFIPPEEAADKLIKTIDGLTKKDSGRFLENDGRDHPSVRSPQSPGGWEKTQEVDAPSRAGSHSRECLARGRRKTASCLASNFRNPTKIRPSRDTPSSAPPPLRLHPTSFSFDAFEEQEPSVAGRLRECLLASARGYRDLELHERARPRRLHEQPPKFRARTHSTKGLGRGVFS